MATLTIPASAVISATGEIVATGVSAEDYLAQYAETHHEWVEGVVFKMAPASARHTLLTQYLIQWFNTYFALNPIGKMFHDPFVMQMDTTGSFREPDLQVILNDNPGQLTETGMIGPADICIEIVSPESVGRDYGQKFHEYETVGVREYWIIDPLRQRCDFNRRNESGLYTVITPDDAGYYHTPLLPKLALYVPTVWQDPLPNIIEIVQTVQAMFSGE